MIAQTGLRRAELTSRNHFLGNIAALGAAVGGGAEVVTADVAESYTDLPPSQSFPDNASERQNTSQAENKPERHNEVTAVDDTRLGWTMYPFVTETQTIRLPQRRSSVRHCESIPDNAMPLRLTYGRIALPRNHMINGDLISKPRDAAPVGSRAASRRLPVNILQAARQSLIIEPL